MKTSLSFGALPHIYLSISMHLRLSIFIYKSITCLVLPDIVNISVGKHRRKDIDT